MARQNAAREPNRTAFTAAALMIGLALVGMSLVVGSSLRTSFIKTLGTGIKGDWYVTTDSFFGFSPDVANQLKQAPEFSAVSGVQQGQMQVAGSTKTFSPFDFSVADELLNLDIQEGGITQDTGLMVKTDVAEELGLQVGDTVTVTFQATGDVPMRAHRDLRELGCGRQLGGRPDHLPQQLHRPDRLPRLAQSAPMASARNTRAPRSSRPSRPIRS